MKLSAIRIVALVLVFVITLSLIPTADSAGRLGSIVGKLGSIFRKAGPSGKPMQPRVQHSPSKAAQDAARNQGKGNPSISSAGKQDSIVGKMGPSGKPMQHSVQHPSRKAAQDAARNQGKGNPPIGHNGHYHPATKNGEKRLPNVHHNYPNSG